MDVSAVLLWVRQVKEAETRGTGIHNRQRSGRLCIALMCNIFQAAELLFGNLCITTDGLSTILFVDKTSVISIIEVLGYIMVITLCV